MRIPEVLSGLDLAGLHIAYSEDLGCAPVDQEIRKVFRARLKAFSHVFATATEAAPDFGRIHDVFEIQRGVTIGERRGQPRSPRASRSGWFAGSYQLGG